MPYEMHCSASGTTLRIDRRRASSVLRFGSSTPARYASISSVVTAFSVLPSRSTLYGAALADHGDAALADGEAAAPVLVVVDTDQGAVGHDDVLVDDRVADHGTAADGHVVEEDAALHGCAVEHHGVGADHRAVHAGTGDDRPGADDRVAHARTGDELRAGQLRVRGEDRPLGVVEVEDRQRRDQVEVGLVV